MEREQKRFGREEKIEGEREHLEQGKSRRVRHLTPVYFIYMYSTQNTI